MDELPPARAARFLPALVAEFRRRGVWRAASLYIVAAWIAIQATGELSAAFELPRTWAAAVVILAVVGFPVVVLVAWLYRIGVGVESEAAPEGLGVSQRQLRWSLAVAMVAGLGVLILSGWLALGRRQRPAPPGPIPSVAVLPFSDDAADPDQTYLARGLTERLIGQLSEVDGLRVISGVVLDALIAKATPYDSIARAFDLDFLVYGSVLRNSQHVEVTVDLIEPYSGEVIDAIRVERSSLDPIALVAAVIGDVGAELLPRMGEALRMERWRAGTSKAEAYELLLRSLERERRAGDLTRADDAYAALSELSGADSLLARALALDGRYTEAMVRRAWLARERAHLHLVLGQTTMADSALREGHRHATRAIATDRDDARAYEIRGDIQHLRRSSGTKVDPEAELRLEAGAFADLEQATLLNPRLAHALHVLALLHAERGDFARALTTYDQAYRVDIYQEHAVSLLGNMFNYSFELAYDSLAESYCAELRRRHLNGTIEAFCELELAAWSSLRGRPAAEQAWAVAAAARSDGASYRRAGPQLEMLVAGVLARAGLADSARAVIARARAIAPGDHTLLNLEAGVRILLGDFEIATALLREYQSHSGSMLLAHSRRFASLPQNPLAPARAD